MGNKFDRVIVPNVPLASAFNEMLNNFWLAPIIKGVINMYQAPLFKTLPADSFLWGYEDDFVDAATAFKPMPFKNFGVLALVSRY